MVVRSRGVSMVCSMVASFRSGRKEWARQGIPAVELGLTRWEEKNARYYPGMKEASTAEPTRSPRCRHGDLVGATFHPTIHHRCAGGKWRRPRKRMGAQDLRAARFHYSTSAR